jgi:hypothetical protein
MFPSSDSDPVDLAVDVMRRCLASESADADDCLEVPGSYLTHAVVNAEPAEYIGIAGMRSLVDECSHLRLR